MILIKIQNLMIFIELQSLMIFIELKSLMIFFKKLIFIYEWLNKLIFFLFYDFKFIPLSFDFILIIKLLVLLFF